MWIQHLDIDGHRCILDEYLIAYLIAEYSSNVSFVTLIRIPHNSRYPSLLVMVVVGNGRPSFLSMRFSGAHVSTVSGAHVDTHGIQRNNAATYDS